MKPFKLLISLAVLCTIQCEIAAYKSEVEVTPAPLDEPTTKKSGFFGGIKSFFRGSPATTTVAPVAEILTPKTLINPTNTNLQTQGGGTRPPSLIIPQAPLVPIGPRPDTPISSPWGGYPQAAPQWPQPENSAGIQHQSESSTTATKTTTLRPSNQQAQSNVIKNIPSSGPVQSNLPLNPQSSQNNIPKPGSAQPNSPPSFATYQPKKPQPSGMDLSYGTSSQQPIKPSIALAGITSTTTTAKPIQMEIDLRGGFGTTDNKKSGSETANRDNFPSLPEKRGPSKSGVNDDFPSLPVPKSPSATPPSPTSPSSPSAWNKPLPTPVAIPSATSTTVKTILPNAPVSGDNRVAFIPHSRTTTTIRPGFENVGNSLATDDEIRKLTETLYTKEINSQINSITINEQGKTRSIDSTDEAAQPLLQVDAKVFDSNTIAKMRALFNNYEVDTMVNEHVTANERIEENEFVDSVLNTNVMRQAMLFLQSKGIVTPDPKTHRDLIKELWFTQYSRGNGKIGSSGFEHVFVNEVKNGTIIGLHNWVYFYDEEKAGRLDYKGYINQLDMGTKGKVMKVRFTHNGLNKPVNTLFVGTSPELELALYTVCFKLRPDRTCPVSLGNSKFGVVTYSWRYRGKSLIGSAYPEI